MFRDDEQSTGKTARLRESGIVVAKNIDDFLEKAEGLKEYLDLMYAGLQIDRLLKKWGKIEDWDKALAGKKILDIAAGSVFSRDHFGDYSSHFARLCAVNGAFVTVIDRNPQGDIDKELFEESLRADLVLIIMGEGLDRYSPLLNKRFDVVSSANFVGNMPENLITELSRRKIDHKIFEDRLTRQASRLLAENGIMSLDNKTYYTKKEGKITPI